MRLFGFVALFFACAASTALAQSLTLPYAGTDSSNSTSNSFKVTNNNTSASSSSIAIQGVSNNTATSTAPIGVYGYASGAGWGVYAASADGYGVYAVTASTLSTSKAVYAAANYGIGVNAYSGYNYGLYARTDFGNAAILAEIPSTVSTANAINANSTLGVGVSASNTSTTQPAVFSNATHFDGLYSQSTALDNGTTQYSGVRAWSQYGWGVSGYTDAQDAAGVLGSSGPSFGVKGVSTNNTAVYASSTNWNGMEAHAGVSGVSGIYAVNDANGGFGAYGRSRGTGVAVYGDNPDSTGFAGYFSGKLHATGSLSTSGSKPFMIDHPSDPANKILTHVAIEGPELKNFYDGIATLDSTGAATVQLPAYFADLNKDFRYQLTCVGGYAPVYIASEISANAFRIAGGTPGLKVSWQVTGNRNDAWARANPVQVEQDKTPAQRGKYFTPEVFGLVPSEANLLFPPATKLSVTTNNVAPPPTVQPKM